jgi:hypothetical protein
MMIYSSLQQTVTSPDGRGENATVAAWNRSLAFAIAAIPIFTFCLEVTIRRAAEFAGFALDPGISLALAATVTCVAMIGAAERRGGVIFGIAVLLAAAATVAALGFRRFPDNGFDAQSYHLPSELRLLAGWKPMVEGTDLILSNSYPSGLWTMLGGFDAIFGFESGRAIVPLVMIAAFSASWSLFRRAEFSAGQSSALALLLVANPVALSQSLSALPDGVLYELTLMLVCTLMTMIEDLSLKPALLAGAALLLVCNVKLTGLYFTTLALVVWCGLLLLRRVARGQTLSLRRAQFALLTAAGLIAVGFAGWRPYATNLIEHHALLYPPASELGYKPGAATQVPPNLDGAGHAKKLAALLFARTDMDGGPVIWKIPGAFARSELKMATDTRNGGFGPFFGVAVVLAFGILALAAVFRTRPPSPLDFRLEALIGLTAYGVITTALFPEPWWARFVPFAWAAPIGASLIACELRPTAAIRSSAVGVAVLLAANSAIAGYDAVRDGVASARDIELKLDRMSSDPGPIFLSRGTLWNSVIDGRHAAEDVWRRRLHDRGKFDVRVLPRERCRALEFLSVDVKRCAAPSAPQG